MTVKVQLYKYTNLLKAWKLHDKFGTIKLSEFMRESGFTSTVYNRNDYMVQDDWELSDEDYTMFLLKWGDEVEEE